MRKLCVREWGIMGDLTSGKVHEVKVSLWHKACPIKGGDAMGGKNSLGEWVVAAEDLDLDSKL